MARDPSAIKDLNAAVENPPRLAVAYALRGEYHLRLAKDKAAALEDFRRAVELEPGYRESLQDSIRESEPH